MHDVWLFELGEGEKKRKETWEERKETCGGKERNRVNMLKNKVDI